MAVREIPGKPGALFIEELGVEIDIRDLRWDSKYDSVSIAAGAMVAGTQFVFWRDLGGKQAIDTNISSPNRLAAGEVMLLKRVGVYIRSASGNLMVPTADFKRCVDDAYLRYTLNDLLVAEGPLFKFQSGYGFVGSEAGAPGIISNGVASTSAADMLNRDQVVTKDMDLGGVMTFFDRNWTAGQNIGANDRMPTFTTPVVVTAVWHGEVKRAVTKG